MIPKTNLDDRNFDDIVAEALRLIPRYCPEWTNHNPSDPGITLVELFAWMTEMTLYRLNKVPEKTYVSLLELMGLSLVPPQASRAVIQFFPVEGYRKSININNGTQIAAALAEDTCIFETEKKLIVHSNTLHSCINRIGETWSDFCNKQKLESFLLFDAHNTVEHALYISSPILQYLTTENYIQISFDSTQEINSVQDEIVNYLYWEYWDGRAWTHVRPHGAYASSRKKDNTIYITGPIPIAPCSIEGNEQLYIRALLSGVPAKRSALATRAVSLRIFFGGSGFIPDVCLSNTSSQYTTIDMNTTFRMFSETPSYNEIFYIAADEIFKNEGTIVRIYFTFSELYITGEENEDAIFSYEYWDGNNWQKLDSTQGFHDSTFGFKQSGEVYFTVPQNYTPTAVNNDEHYWLRIRLLTKDFSIGGEYIRDDKNNWLWQFSKKVHSPILNKIRIIYESKAQTPEAAYTYSNFMWNTLPQLCKNTDSTDSTSTERAEIELFSLESDATPALFLGFSSAFPEGDTSLYIKINESLSSKPKEKRLSFFEDLVKSQQQTRKRLVDILWEYWNGETWYPLSVNDYTDSFHESGFVEFTVPKDINSSQLFGTELVWLRIRLLSGSFENQPEIEAIILNAVYAKNARTFKNEIIASGTGSPGQTATPAHAPIIPGMMLSVDEGSIPSTNEITAMKAEGITKPYIQEEESVWVRYKEVDNFYSSTPFSRHYVVDYQANRIYFGDGQRGVNPPRKKFNIRLDSYETGGGSEGNVAAHTLRIMSQNIPFIAACNNPFPAEGGADMENVDNLKSRAAGVFKSLQRAVTAEDFEWLSREASASVGRACCLKEKSTHGEIVVIIMPVLSKDATMATQLIPSRELLRRVGTYLNERKLVGTRVRVQAPLYRTFHITISLSFKSDVLDSERMKKNITHTLHSYFHVLCGNTGDGWELGKVVSIGSVLKQLEKVDGILSVDEIKLFDNDAGITEEKIILKNDEFPFLAGITIENRREET